MAITLSCYPNLGSAGLDVSIQSLDQCCQSWTVENSGLLKFRYTIVLYRHYIGYLSTFGTK